MRSFLSRFTLSSVAALALAGLIAGCSGGGTSSSLPTASLPAANLGAARPMKLSAAQLALFHKMTPQQIADFNSMLTKSMTKAGRPNGFSSSSGIPGAFGLSTYPTGNPNPLGGITANISAYGTSGAHPPAFILQLPPGTGGGNAGSITNLYLAVVSPGGNGTGSGCFIPYVQYESSAPNNGGTITAQNNYGWVNECARPRTGFYTSVDNWYNFSGFRFVNPGSPPIISVRESSDSSGTYWELDEFCFTCSPAGFYFFPGLGQSDSTGNGNTTLPGNGAALWLESPLAQGACQVLAPSANGGLQINSVNYTPPGSYTFTPATPGNTLFDPPNTNIQSCFINDGSFAGSVYAVNAAGQPFFTSTGAQFIVTSNP